MSEQDRTKLVYLKMCSLFTIKTTLVTGEKNYESLKRMKKRMNLFNRIPTNFMAEIIVDQSIYELLEYTELNKDLHRLVTLKA